MIVIEFVFEAIVETLTWLVSERFGRRAEWLVVIGSICFVALLLALLYWWASQP